MTGDAAAATDDPNRLPDRVAPAALQSAVFDEARRRERHVQAVLAIAERDGLSRKEACRRHAAEAAVSPRSLER